LLDHAAAYKNEEHTMERHHLHAQLKQMLKRGHTAEELRQSFDLPNVIINEAIETCLSEIRNEQRYQRSQQNQASYAMGL